MLEDPDHAPRRIGTLQSDFMVALPQSFSAELRCSSTTPTFGRSRVTIPFAGVPHEPVCFSCCTSPPSKSSGHSVPQKAYSLRSSMICCAIQDSVPFWNRTREPPTRSMFRGARVGHPQLAALAVAVVALLDPDAVGAPALGGGLLTCFTRLVMRTRGPPTRRPAAAFLASAWKRTPAPRAGGGRKHESPRVWPDEETLPVLGPGRLPLRGWDGCCGGRQFLAQSRRAPRWG